jgi:hypothetical protein
LEPGIASVLGRWLALRPENARALSPVVPSFLDFLTSCIIASGLTARKCRKKEKRKILAGGYLISQPFANVIRADDGPIDSFYLIKPDQFNVGPEQSTASTVANCKSFGCGAV